MPRTRFQAGDKVGPWTLVEFLGGGGNAEVWKAWAIADRFVALKILKSQSALSEPFQRFNNEVVLLRKLSKVQGIVPLIDSCTSKFPAWIALEIADCLENNKDLPFVELAQRFSEIATTLDEVARTQVFHRDIKPANLFIYNNRGAISDFGLATFPDKESITAEGKKIGPVYYIAPEMLNEAASAKAAPADVYSLAKSFWVLASGQTYPLPGQLARNFELFRISTWVTDQRAILLEEVLERATDPDPNRRPTMEKFGKELRASVQYRDVVLSLVKVGDIARNVQGNLLRRKRDEAQIAARKKDFESLATKTQEFASRLGATLADQLGADFVTTDQNANKLYLHQTVPGFQAVTECHGGVVVVWAGEAHRAHTLQFLCGLIVIADSNDYLTVRVIAAQLCCRHIDEQKQFLWKEEVTVSGGLAEQYRTLGDLATNLEQNLHLGLKVFEEQTK